MAFMNIRLVGCAALHSIFCSLTENAVMDAFVWVQCVLHQQVSVWHSASMSVS